MPMKKITVNALVDLGCLVTFIPSLISGLVLYLVLPSGSGRGSSGIYLGLYRETWLNMHNYSSLVFAALLILHLLLHWNFFRNIRNCLITNTREACDMPDP